MDKCKKRGIDDITGVAGYKASRIDVSGIDVLVNDYYSSTGELASLSRAVDTFTDDMVIMYGDLLFRSYILRDLIESDAALSVVVDSSTDNQDGSGTQDFAFCSEPDDRSMWGQAVSLKRIASSTDTHHGKAPNGRWIGMIRVKGSGREWLTEAIAELRDRADFARLGIPDLINFMLDGGRDVRVWYIHGHWLDVNSLTDLERAGDFAAEQDA